MATKKEKTIIIKTTRKAKAPVDSGRIVLALQALVATEGWAVIVRVCQGNIEHLEKAIIDKRDPETKAVLSEVEVDLLRAKRDYLVELRDTPANFSKKLQSEAVTPEEFDPYYKTAEDVIRERRLKG